MVGTSLRSFATLFPTSTPLLLSMIALPLKRFRAKWMPVRVKKTRQNKNLELRSDSIGTEIALALGTAALSWSFVERPALAYLNGRFPFVTLKRDIPLPPW